MYDLFGALKSIVARKKSPTIDDAIFRLHYKTTACLMLAFCIVLSAGQYIGDPIDCFGSSSAIPGVEKVVDEYCWITSTFTLPRALSKRVGTEVAYPAIDTSKENDEKIYHKYYQWVGFVLFFQAMLFYMPHYLWKIWEGGRLQSLVMDLNLFTLNEESRKTSTNILINYYIRNLNNHNFYFVKFLFCEVINLINVIAQIFITDKFLGGEFSTYGLDVVKFISFMDQEERVDPMVKVFPKMTKCIFHYYGASGDVQKKDFLCILPLNIVNEKIYVFLWFWFVVLATLSGIQICFRILTILFPRVRYFVLKTRARLVADVYLNAVLRRAHAGDWFLLYQLSKNVESLSFGEFIESLAKRIDSSSSERHLLNSANGRIDSSSSEKHLLNSANV